MGLTETITSTIQPFYDAHIRPRLPRRLAHVTGVRTHHRRLFDVSHPGWSLETNLVSAIHRVVRPGNHVVLVGGGRGISTVHAARRAGESGHVDVYEATSSQLVFIRDTIALNDTAASIGLHHAAVSAVSEFSKEMFDSPDGDTIPPTELPSADVAILDCEGAEGAIVPVIDVDRIAVETHGFLGDATAPDAIRDTLESRDFRVDQHGVDDAEQGVEILVGCR